MRPPELLSELDDSLGSLVLLLPALVLFGGGSERIHIYNSGRRLIFYIRLVLIIKLRALDLLLVPYYVIRYRHLY